MFPLTGISQNPEHASLPRPCSPTSPHMYCRVYFVKLCILALLHGWPRGRSERECCPCLPRVTVTFPSGDSPADTRVLPRGPHGRCVWADRARVGFHRRGWKVNSVHPQLRVAMKPQLGLQRISFCLESGQSRSCARSGTVLADPVLPLKAPPRYKNLQEPIQC